MKYIFALITILLGQIVMAQTTITGTITDQQSEAIESVSVMLKDKNTKAITSVAFTDAKGKYTLKTGSKPDSLWIEVSRLGYKTQLKLTLNKSKEINFILEEGEFELAAIKVKAPPIRRKGDTLSYSVEQFQRESDKSIGDVLQRLPGVSKDAQGDITYQGEKINRYYVEDLDLLGRRYDLVNENLPKGKVATIQIFENHQPIRVLDSLEVSERAAINLKLTNKITKAFVTSLATGLSPILWDANITPMVFTPNFQFIASIQSNNIGNDLKSTFFEHNISHLAVNNNWTGITAPRPPMFSAKRWMNNQSHGLTLNTINKLNKDNQLRVNASLYLDNQEHLGFREQNYFLGQEVISYSENMNAHFKTNQFNMNLRLQNNSPKSYFNEEFKFQRNWKSDQGINDRIINYYNQNAKTEDINLSNNLRRAFHRNGKIYDFSSQLVYANTNQNLKVRFVDTDSTANPIQLFSNSNFGASNTVSFNTKIANRLTSGILIGSLINLSKINTDLQDYNELQNTQNNFDWNNFKTFISSRTQFVYKDLDMSLNLPLAHYFIDYKPLNETRKSFSKIVPEPSYSIRYRPNMSSTFGGNVSYREMIASLGDIYGGYVMSNYLSLNNRDSDFRNTKMYSGSLSFNFNDVVTGFSFNTSYRLSHRLIDKQTETIIQDDGSRQTLVGEHSNTMNSNGGNLNISKYFFNIKTTVSLGSNFTQSKSSSWINGENRPYKSNIYRPNLEINFGGIQNASIYYRLDYSHISYNIRPSLSQLNQNLSVAYRIFEGFSSTLTFEHYQYNQNGKRNFFFGDLGFKYRIPKTKRDIELNFVNLFNQKEYTTLNISDYASSYSSYQLRPRQFLIRTEFGF